MAAKKTPVDLTPGTPFETIFWRNEGAQRETFPWRATTVGATTSTKVILCADPAVPLGKPVRAKVLKIKRPQSDNRGFIEAAYLGPVEFHLDPDIYIDPHTSTKLQVLLEAGYSILLDGPQGSGKTVLSRALATALDMHYVYFNCASVYEATDFIATLQIRATEQGATETVFVPTNFRSALLEAQQNSHLRYLVFLDEFNRCRPMARNGLMPALDSTRKVYDPETGDLLHIPDNVQFVAAINNGDQFSGTSAVDLRIGGNDNLRTLNSNGMIRPDSLLSIFTNDNLVDLGGLGDLTGLDHLSLTSNNAVVDYSTLGDLSGISDLELRSHDYLENLVGFGSITSLDRLHLHANDGLLDLSGMESLTHVGDGGLWITENESLCGSIALEFAAGIEIAGDVDIFGNAGCKQ